VPHPFVSGALDDEVEIAIRIHSRRLVGVAGFTTCDLEDIQQEMRLDVIAGLPRFNPRLAQRSTFITRIIERKARQLVRHRRAQMRDRRREAFSLNAVVMDGEGRSVARMQLITAADQVRRVRRRTRLLQHRESLRENVARAIATLPAGQQKLCRLVRQVGLDQVRRDMRVSQAQLDALVKRIRRHFTKAGLRAYLEE